MQQISRYAVILLCLASSFVVNAEGFMPTKLKVGTGAGEIGLIQVPEQECLGPLAMTPNGEGGVVILDGVNHKLALVAQSGRVRDVRLPPDLFAPQDILATAGGYVVAGVKGDVVLIDEKGAIRARTVVKDWPGLSAATIVPLSEDQLSLEDIRGNRRPIALDPKELGKLVVPGFVRAATYEFKPGGADRALLFPGNEPGLNVKAALPIAAAQVLWANNESAIVSIQESRGAPNEGAYFKLLEVDKVGNTKLEVYLGPETFGCEMRRPYTRLTDGRVVDLEFSHPDYILLNVVAFAPPGKAKAKALVQSGNQLSTAGADGDNRAAKTKKVSAAVALGYATLAPVTRESILDRARAAEQFKWTLGASNFAHHDVPNECSPPRSIWRRPEGLDKSLGKDVTGVPYRWGGYFNELAEFQRTLAAGKLAGDNCTCRVGNCVHPQATGLDCSGFVSYAWQIGQKYGTGNLPDARVSKPLTNWTDLAPGDIVNRKGKHVRLVTEVGVGRKGVFVKVIEATTLEACGSGKVCAQEYLESDLVNNQYFPFRRVSLSN